MLRMKIVATGTDHATTIMRWVLKAGEFCVVCNGLRQDYILLAAKLALCSSRSNTMCH